MQNGCHLQQEAVEEVNAHPCECPRLAGIVKSRVPLPDHLKTQTIA